MSIGRVFNTAVGTMQAYQKAIDTASNNISNSGNTDYTRERVVFGTVTAENGIGAGIKVQDVQRVRNELTDAQIRKYQSQYSEADTKASYLSQIETLVSEPSDNGLSTYIAAFFNSWDELTTDATSLSSRSNIIKAAQELSDRIKETYDGLGNMEITVRDEASTTVDQINNYLKDISSLNQKIYESEVRGNEANDLKDQRDKALDSLSKLVNINVQMNDKGAAIVSVGGIQGADAIGYNEFELVNVDGKLKLATKEDNNITAVVNGGVLSADFDLYSNKIPDYLSKLESFATTFANKVNEIHKTGYTLAGDSSSSTNINFFGKLDDSGNWVVFDGGELVISDDILNDTSNIAASDASNNDGNSNIANQIARLGDSKISELNNQTFLQNYNSILSKIGTDKTSSDNNAESSNTILTTLKNQKSSESGVSLDEEEANILVYQRAYQASAKLISIADELLQTLLSMVA
jgi:flagellar hook-associated protein 1